MSKHRWVKLAQLATLLSIILWAPGASAQVVEGYITGFEGADSPSEVTYPTGYVTGFVSGQDGWGGTRSPRIQTETEIAAELTAAGLNPANAVRSGNQALLLGKLDTEAEIPSPGPGGYLVNNFFTTVNSSDVIVDWWARPLTSGEGADPSGSPAGNGKTIGERQGNTFVGVMDATEQRVAAVRFGVDTVGNNPYTNVTERHIDFGTAAVSGVWQKSGLLWEADVWYNFKFDLDFETKKYDFYVNGQKVNAEPIRFYTEAASDASRFFVSRGTNQAGQIIDDVRITAQTAVPGDFDQSGAVDGNDFLVWQRDVNVGSLEDWKANFGTGPIGAVAAVPEPNAAAICFGMAVLAVRRRSRAALSRRD